MRAVIYTRVSLDRRRGRSVAQQETECRAFCERQGWTVARVFSDPGRSASRYATKDRPDFDALIAFLPSGEADVLVTWEASRPTRDLEVFLPLRRLCEEVGILYSYDGRVYDLRDPDDRERVTTDAVKAEAESGRTSKRVQRDVRANAAAGRPHGRNLFGYRRVYDPITRELVEVVKHPEEAETVREAVRRVLAGEKLFHIRADFIARGVPAPGRAGWDLTAIRRILRNPAYLGKRVHRGQVVADAVWPRLIEDSDWDQLQALLDKPGRRTTVRQGELRHLVSYIATCARGGEHVSGADNKGTPTYRCSAGHVSKPRGQWRGWPDRPDEWADQFDGVDDLVTCVVLERLARPDLLSVLAADGGDSEHQAAVDQLAALQQRLDGFVDAAAAGELTPAALARIERRLLPQIEVARRLARPRLTEPASELVADLIDMAGQPAQVLAGHWAALGLAQRRQVIQAFFRIELLPAGRGNRRVFDPSSVRMEWIGPAS